MEVKINAHAVTVGLSVVRQERICGVAIKLEFVVKQMEAAVIMELNVMIKRLNVMKQATKNAVVKRIIQELGVLVRAVLTKNSAASKEKANGVVL